MFKKGQPTFPVWMKVSLFAMVLVLLAVGVWFVRAQQQMQRQSIEENLLSIADLKIRQIAEWRAEKIADATILTSRKALTDSIQRYLANPTVLERAEILRRLRPVRQRYRLADVLVVSAQKKVELSLTSNAELCPEHASAIDEAFAERHCVLTPLHQSPKVKFPHISIVAPLFSGKGEKGPVGAVILLADASQFLYPLIQSWPTPRKTAETLLVQKDGDDVLFLNELRHKKDTALKYRIPLSRTDLPAAMAINGVKGIVEGKDYRGVDVIAAILPVPESPWFMISKIDAAEAFAEWRFRSIMIAVLFLGGLALVAAAAIIVRQRNLKAHYRALYESAATLSQALKRHGITLQAIGDAVISTDAEGRVDLMNPVAEALTGWSQGEAKGRALQEVFYIVNEKTRELVEDPVVKVLKEGTVVGLANHTLLIARDGREVPIADSGSPIRDEEGNIIGVVLVFKDQSSERQYQNTILEREKRYRLLADNTLDVIWTMNMDLEFTYVNPAIRQMTGYRPEEWIGTRLSEHCDEEAFAKMADIITHEIAKGQEHSRVGFEVEMLRKDKSIYSVEIHGKIIFDERGNPVMLQGSTRDISYRKQAERELKSQKDRFENILQGTNVGTWEWNVQTGETFFNERWANIIGYTLDEITPTSIEIWGEYTHPEDLERSNSALEAHFKGELDYYEIECRMKHKDGHWIWIHDKGKVISWTDGGKPLRMYGTHQDITYRKKTEERLRRSEELSNSIQRLGKIGAWEWDISGQKVFWTEELYRIHDLEPDPVEHDSGPMVEKSLSCYTPDDRLVIQDAFRRCIEDGTPYKLEFLFTTVKGRRIWIETSAQRIVGENGSNRVIGYIMDISERKQSEELLLSQERRYSTILKAAVDGFWLTDLEGRILEVNDAYCRMSGYSEKELLSMSIPEVEGKLGPDEVASKIQEIARQGQDRFDTKHRRKDGSLFDVEVSTQHLPTENGKLVVFLRDITMIKEAEQEKEHLQAQLLHAQRMESVGRLAGGVAHDFNNMLSVILGYSELALVETGLSQGVHTALQEIMKAAERSADITRRLLAFARKQTVSPKVLDLNKTVAGMTKMLERLIGEDIDLAWLLGEGVWPVMIDPAQIDQILANLCVNARDAIEDVGKVTIETGNVEFDEAYCKDHLGFLPGEYVLLAVSDNGCGMSAEILENVFDPFFTTKESGKGTGLGLAMVYGIVKQNNGFINVYSEPGHGTTVRVYLPRHRAKGDLISEKGKEHPAERGHETILLVEDEPAILEMTTMMLESLGYTVMAARTPGEAIEFAQRQGGEIHLLVTDVVMPEMNGLDLAKRVLAIHPNLKHLFMSGYTANVIAHHGVLDEGVSFIQKPFSMKQIGAKVREVLEGKG